jgi:hypothetical protein
MWIGITGAARSGKDTVYQILKEHFGEDCQRFGFADKLKDSACALLNINREQLEGLKIFDSVKFRLILDEDWGGPVDYCFPDDDIMVEPFTMRALLQRYGTEAHRDIFGKDFWVEQLFNGVNHTMLHNKICVITDVRFDNEAQAIKVRDGLVIRLVRSGTGEMQHASEVPINHMLVDYVIFNDGSLDDLKKKVIALIDRGLISNA